MKLNDPTVSGSSADGTFIDKDEKNGIAGTLLKAKVFNQIIYEFNTLIKEGGLIPSDKDLTQVYTAVRNLYTNADNELKNYLDNRISIESNKIIEEVKERKEADSNLQNQIDTANIKITQEINDRKNANVSLQNKINQEITDRQNSINNVENQIRNINMFIEETSSFIIKEVLIKSGSGTQSWALNWRSDLEYLQVSGYVVGTTYSGEFGLYNNFNNDDAPFIGWKKTSSDLYYYGGEFRKPFLYSQAGLPNLEWFPILNNKPVIAIKNAPSNQSITVYLYFLVRKK